MNSASSNQTMKLSPLMFDDEEDDGPQPSFAQLSSGEHYSASVAYPPPQVSPRSELNRTVTDSSDRLTKLHQMTQEKIKTLREKREKEALAECTFSPKLHSVSPPRSFEEFYTCQKVHENSRKDRIERQHKELLTEKQLEEMREIKQAGMSPGSRDILKEKRTLTLIERLNVPKRSQTPSKPPPGPKASKDEIRQIVKRLNKPPEPVSPTAIPACSQYQSVKSVVNVKSEEMITTALEREIEACWTGLDLGDKVNYVQFEFLLREMRYVVGSGDKGLMYQAWIDMKGEEKGYIRKDTVMGFLSAISGTVISKESTEETDTSENSALSFATSPVLRAKYQSFLDNHKANRRKKEVKGPEYSFHPQISPGSQQILQSRAVPLSDAPPKPPIRDHSPQAVLRDMMKDCTFQPNVSKPRTVSTKVRYLGTEVLQGIDSSKAHRTDLLFLHGKVLREKKDREKPIDYEYEKNKAELTFSPQISPRAATPTRNKPPSGYEKTVERLRKANQESERVRALQERGVPLTRPHVSPHRSPKAELSPVLKHKVRGKDIDKSPFSTDLMDILTSEEPELMAKLHLPSGKTIELTVYKGESLEEKLAELARREGLSEEQREEYLESLRED